MDRLEAMEMFVRVVERGSFTEVAREMRKSQPTVSKQIAALEENLGVKLLNRSTRQVSMTDEGERFYERAVTLLSDWEQARQMAAEPTEHPIGRLRISCPVAFGRHHVVPHMGDFLELYPDVELEVMMNDRHVDLIAEGVDVAVRIGELQDSTLIAKRIGYSPRVVVATPEYLERHEAPLTTLEDLTEHNCLVFANRTLSSKWRLEDAEGEPRMVEASGNFRTNTSEALLGATLAGVGVAILPLWLIHQELDRGELVHLLEEFTPWCPAIYAMYPSGRYLPSKTRCFVEFVLERFDGAGWNFRALAQ